MAHLMGQGAHRYRPVIDWMQLPPGWELVEVAAAATDSENRVYVFNRGRHSVIVFSPEGDFLHSWEEGLFVRAHGITIGPDDAVYCVDDLDHTVKKLTCDGRPLLTLGVSGRFSDTGATTLDYRTIRRSGICGQLRSGDRRANEPTTSRFFDRATKHQLRLNNSRAALPYVSPSPYALTS